MRAAVHPVEAVQEGELDIDALLRRYAPYVARIGFGILGAREDVDDLVQDVFVALMSSIRRLREPAAIRHWLATTAVRMARRKLRWRRWRLALGLESASEPDCEALVAPGATPEQLVLLAHLRRALDRLPVDLRVAWCLRHVEGEELTRIAALCGCSLATVKRRIAAAEIELKREVGGE
jgi:RNA polymerase sigma-70 factor (ECF subfamily)